MVTPIFPVKEVNAKDVLYGDRITAYRWDVLEHVDGIDVLVGTLDGVADGSLRWVNNAAVKGSGTVEVIDIEFAQEGMLRIADLKLESVRLRPVSIISGNDTAGHWDNVSPLAEDASDPGTFIETGA